MFQSQTCFIIAAALLLAAVVESRYMKLQDVPITPEGISMRIVIKEDLKSGKPMASVKIVMDDTEKVKPPPAEEPKTLHEELDVPEVIPTFEDRLGIGADKCPFGRIRKGPICIAIN